MADLDDIFGCFEEDQAEEKVETCPVVVEDDVVM